VLLKPTAEALADDLTGGDDRPGPGLRIAALGNDAGLIGAADLAREVAPQG
jgi:glucokinase